MLAAEEAAIGVTDVGRQVQPRQPQRPGLERVEDRAEPFGDEDDRPAVGREGRLEVGIGIVVSRSSRPLVQPVAIQVKQTSRVAGEDQSDRPSGANDGFMASSRPARRSSRRCARPEDRSARRPGGPRARR